MSRVVHRTLCRIFAVVLALAGIGALVGGNFAHGYVTDQLSQERITMPEGKALATQQMRDSMGKWAGQQLTTGPQAQAYANDYILAHMNEASGNRSYSEVSGAYMGCSKDPATKDTAECTQLGQVRQTLFMGDALRGMLLTAYAW